MRTLFALLCPLLLQAVTLQLSGDHADASREYSGLAWHGERLVLLPQYPDNQLFTLARTDLERSISKGTLLTPDSISFDDRKIQKQITGYEGYEAIAFEGTDVYALIEARTWLRSMRAYLVKGSIDDGGIVMTQVIELPLITDIDNYSYEALSLTPSGILAFYEANGLSKTATALLVNRELNRIESISISNVPYRITDLTSYKDGSIWALNTFWKGDRKKLQVKRKKNMGRLVKFTLTPERVAMSKTSVSINSGGGSFNWEGVVRFGERGFIVITDTHPTSVLRYVEMEP
jgi:hypothetical protein